MAGSCLRLNLPEKMEISTISEPKLQDFHVMRINRKAEEDDHILRASGVIASSEQKAEKWAEVAGSEAAKGQAATEKTRRLQALG